MHTFNKLQITATTDGKSKGTTKPDYYYYYYSYAAYKYYQNQLGKYSSTLVYMRIYLDVLGLHIYVFMPIQRPTFSDSQTGNHDAQR